MKLPEATRLRLVICWTALVLLGYLARSHPEWRDLARGWIADLGRGESFRIDAVAPVLPGHAASLGALAAVIAAWLAGGAPAARWIVPAAAGADRTVVSGICGAGVIALVIQGLGLAGLLFTPLIAIPAAVLVVRGIRTLPGAAAAAGRTVRDSAIRVPAMLAASAIAAGWLGSRLPGVNEDAAAQHFAIPEQCLVFHRLVAQPSNTLWHLSLGGEMLYLPLRCLGGIAAAKLVNVGAALLLLLLVRRLAAALGASKPGAWWAAAALGSIAFVPGSCWGGKNDLIAVLFFSAAAWSALRGRGGGGGWWAAAGWFLGLAAGAKYTVVYLAPGLVAAAVWPGARRPGRGATAAAAGLAAAGVAGWMARNWLTVGNPFHPVLSGVFPEPFWTPFHEAAMEGGRRAFSTAAVKSPWYPALAPWDVTLDPSFGSPLLAVALAAVFLPGPASAPAGALLAAAYVPWIFSERFGRYLAPLLPVVAAAAIPPLARGSAVRAAAAVLILWQVGVRAAATFSPSGWRVVLGQTPPRAYLRSTLTTWEEAREWAAARTTVRDGLLLTGDERRLGIGGRVVTPGGVPEPMWLLTGEAGSARILERRLRQMGIRWILYNHVQGSFRGVAWVRSPPWSPRQLAVYRDFMARHARPVYWQSRVDYLNGGFAGWRIAVEPAARPRPVSCLPQAEGRFRRAIDLLSSGAMTDALAEVVRVKVPGGGVVDEDELLAYCELLGGRPDAARARFRTGIDSGFVLRGGFGGYSACLASAGDLDGAIRWKSREWLFLELDETLEELGWLLSARALERDMPAGRAEAAFRDLDRAAFLVPDEAGIPEAAAAALDRLGRRREALWYEALARARLGLSRGPARLPGRPEGTITQ